MSRNYDLGMLSPREFEFLCRDIIQRKISHQNATPFIFNSFSEGADGGIDAIHEDKNNLIILQCKRYKSFSQLYTNLKTKELPKVLKNKPTRYIIATSCDLSQAQVGKIYDLFSPYIKDTGDISGIAMLNNLLALYPDIELNYPKLYLSNASVLNRLLHSGTFNQSEAKLREFIGLSKYYAQSPSFGEAMDILKKTHYVIISGEPGVGKSTLAGMLSLFYTEDGYEFIFIRKSIQEGWAILDPNKRQVFLFDDFLGSTNFDGLDKNEDRSLLDFIKAIKKQEKLLVITTREYVFRQAEVRYPELKELHFSKCIILQKEFTDAFKINILYNYLYYSKVEWKHIKPLIEHYEDIIHHRNFTPRFVSDFIDKYYSFQKHEYFLYLDLKKYIDNPFDYWEAVFLKLSEGAQALLLILAMTEEPAIDEVILETFKNYNNYRHLFDKGYEFDAFEKALTELSRSFISILKNPDIEKDMKARATNWGYWLIFSSVRTSRFIEFQNPSIKDFSVKYLASRPDIVMFLIKSAILFNQLFFIFTTRSDDRHIEDYEATYPHDEYKIQLSKDLIEVLKEKIILNFELLPIAKVQRVHWTSNIDTFHLDEETFTNRITRLHDIAHYFPPEKYPDIKDYLIQKYIAIKDDLSLEERISQSDFLFVLNKCTQLDPFLVLKEYLDNIRFSKEYICLHNLSMLFPDAYKAIVNPNLISIRKKIKHLISDDIDYFLWEGTKKADESLDLLLDIDIPELSEIYSFKLSKSFKKRMNEIAGYSLFKEVEIIEDDPDEIDDHEPKEAASVKREKKQLEKQRYEGFKIALKQLTPVWRKSGKKFIQGEAGLNDLAKGYLERIAYYFLFLDIFVFKKETFEETLSSFMGGEIGQNLEMAKTLISSPFIDQSDIWFRFLSIDLQMLLSMQHILRMAPEKRADLYGKFKTNDDELYCQYYGGLWKLCFKHDGHMFKKYFIIPVIQKEVDSLNRELSEENTLAYLNENNFDFDYEYFEAEQSFETTGLGGGNALMEDILREFDFKITSPMWDIGDCFNLSYTKDQKTKNYINKHCLKEREKYSINISEELKNKDFHPLLKSSGVIKIVTEYVNRLKIILADLKC